MKKTDIEAQPHVPESKLRKFFFPHVGLTVEAEDMEQAEAKLNQLTTK